MHSNDSSAKAQASPLFLKSQDADMLAQSEGFEILRQHLANHYFYPHISSEDFDHCLLVRDILHALLVPVVELFDKACGVAAAGTHATKFEDLEYAFTGQSRSAFVWLQCFLSSETEREWCYTRGCPACVAHHSLDSEFTIRLLYAACLLSDVHYPFTIEGPTLPSFMFFLESVQEAAEVDELYGSDFFETMQPKATATRDGVEELIHQCLELDVLLSQPSSPQPCSPQASLPASPLMGPLGDASGMKIKRSKMARRQMRLEEEEGEWLEDMLRRCFEKLQPEVHNGLLPIPTPSLDAVLKSCHSFPFDEAPPE